MSDRLKSGRLLRPPRTGGGFRTFIKSHQPHLPNTPDVVHLRSSVTVEMHDPLCPEDPNEPATTVPPENLVEDPEEAVQESASETAHLEDRDVPSEQFPLLEELLAEMQETDPA